MKLFTALGVGLLAVNEIVPIGWDTKINDILPNMLWVLQDPIAQRHANLVDILSHRTSLPCHDASHSLTDTPESAMSRTYGSHSSLHNELVAFFADGY